MAPPLSHWWRGLLLLALLATACTSAHRPEGVPQSGLVVETVKAEGLAARAGIQPGDLLLSWQRGDAGGELVSPFDLDQVRVEEAPRGAVTLQGTRGGKVVSPALAEGEWDVEVRPRLEGPADPALAQALTAESATELLVPLARAETRPAVRAWLLTEAAEAAKTDAAEELWAEAVGCAGDAAVTRAWVEHRHGRALLGGRRLNEAAAAFSRALESWPEGTLPQAASLNNLGIIAQYRGDLEAAEAYHGRALEIRERLAPDSVSMAGSLTNLGTVAWSRGDLGTAEQLRRRALEIQERLAPGSLAMASSLGNLGLVAKDRGDLEAAERYLRQALKLAERLTPGSLDVAKSLNNLGLVAFERGDLNAAERYYRRALEIKERLAPDSIDVANSLNNLANVTWKRLDLEAAEQCHRRALEIRERLAPGSLGVASSLSNLAKIARDRGDLVTAEQYHRRALETREHLAPDSLHVAQSLADLGNLAQENGDLQTAERHLRRALEICQRLAPGSSREAGSLFDLAGCLRAAGRRSEALENLRQAVRALESQQRRMGGTPEQLAEFRAEHLSFYVELVDLLLEVGRPEEAFEVLESARARALLAMLAERDIMGRDVPRELERERRIATADFDRTMAALGELSAADEEERAQLLDELDAIRERQEEIRAKIRAASPRLAELRYPEPLSLAAAAASLDPGTLLLEYSLGPVGGHLFALGPEAGRFAVYPLPVGEEELRAEVDRVRRLLERPRGELAKNAGAIRREALKSLSATLLAPAEEAIGGSARVTIVPDGPLHLLPFGALLDPTAGYERYLVESKPLSVVASATVLAQLQAQRHPPREAKLAAFGDPTYPAAEASGERRAASGGLDLQPLPATRLEVQRLGELFGDRAALWLGSDATEERAKAVDREATIVHFAAHGLVDELRPLSSALALTIPEHAVEGQDNGLLQAWEVFEQVRLDADLVVLSACETALGKEVAGEGMLGLTRAFQYAGARSVLASLWSVADESTAELMQRFYENLEAGMAKDEALRAAQVGFIQGKAGIERDLSHPFYWAAFQLYGDWK